MKIIILIATLIMQTSFAQTDLKKSLVDYDDFETLVKAVKNHREKRLINLDTYLKMNAVSEFVILDTRSKKMYDQKHIKGAIHLNFSDFNQYSLKELLPNSDARILIYCNNNIEDDPISFITKSVVPSVINKNIKQRTLALNIPTYINLYGYGYRNVYELSELISTKDARIKFSNKNE